MPGHDQGHEERPGDHALLRRESASTADSSFELDDAVKLSLLTMNSPHEGGERPELLPASDDGHDHSASTVEDRIAERMSWRKFATAYSYGMFDPFKIPYPPRRKESAPDIPSAASSSGINPPLPKKQVSMGTSSGSDSLGDSSSQSVSSSGTLNSFSSAPATSASSIRPASISSGRSMASALASRDKTFELESLHFSNGHIEGRPPARPDALQLPSYSLAAASVRVASTSFRAGDFAPLAVPSPERELLDPMAAVYDQGPATGKSTADSDPGPSRPGLSESMPTLIPTHTLGDRLPAIQASPMESPGRDGTGSQQPGDEPHDSQHLSLPGSGGIVHSRIPPASAPLDQIPDTETTPVDYFGAGAPHLDRNASYNSQSSSQQTVTSQPTPSVPSRQVDEAKATSWSARERSKSVALPHELPELFDKYGWLPAPLPPDEEARRRALFRFNILHTNRDPNFDRLSILAKMVFQSKLALIAIIDADRQWNKSFTGIEQEENTRLASFCSHAILNRFVQVVKWDADAIRSDEPFIVLDTHLDWRFKNHPQVVNKPFLRFYAGAPLRTPDGHNLGTLCIGDDKPRLEFSPRQRHILKEFAAVVMREMELWRDKVCPPDLNKAKLSAAVATAHT